MPTTDDIYSYMPETPEMPEMPPMPDFGHFPERPNISAPPSFDDLFHYKH